MRFRDRLRTVWLTVLTHTLNPATSKAARSGHGPFWLVRHVGRRSGRTYETPLILARVDGGFMAELTYGPGVSWYRNVVAAHGAEVVRGDHAWRVGAPQERPADVGRAAFPAAARVVLRLLRRRDFRFLPELPGPPGEQHDRLP